MESVNEPARSPSEDRPARSGFSLVELLAVLILCALLAGMAGLSVRSHLQRIQLVTAIEQLSRTDQLVRRRARQTGRVVFLKIQTEPPRFSIDDGRSQSFPHGIVVQRVRTARQSSARGSLRLRVSSTGQSDDYAVQLAGRDGGRRWLVVLGRSGQQLVLDSEPDVASLFPIP